MLKAFWLSFVPLFVAVDAIGVLPLFMNITSDLPPEKFRRILFQSVLTAGLVALLFLFGGTALLKMMGITVADFMIAGGILLFTFSMSDLLTTEKVRRKVDPESVGAVPLGVPLITGPAVLTTSILLAGEHGMFIVALSILVNVIFAGIVFAFSVPISRFLGDSGTKILSKIASLFLASIGVMMVRKGIFSFL